MSLNTAFTSELDARIGQLKADRVYKRLNYLDSPQSARVQMEGRGEVLILSSNNYLGLCDEPSVIEAGIRGLRRYWSRPVCCKGFTRSRCARCMVRAAAFSMSMTAR